MDIFLLLALKKMNRNYTDCDLLVQFFFHITTMLESSLVAGTYSEIIS